MALDDVDPLLCSLINWYEVFNKHDSLRCGHIEADELSKAVAKDFGKKSCHNL